MKKNLIITYDEYIIKFREMIKSLGLNNSTQREYVLKILFECSNHLSAEQIQLKVKQLHNVSIGIATVYRIVSLLEDLKIINSISIAGSDSKVYELNLVLHHDHIICVDCKKIVEFENNKIEKLQESVAKENNFILQTHNMILYGICQECQENEQ